MRLLLSLTFILSTVFNIIAQDTLNPEWVRIQSSPVPSGNSEAWCVGTESNGEIYWGVNQDSQGVFEFMNAYTYHLDDANNLIWVDSSATGVFAQQSYVLYATDSIVYLAGRTCRTTGLDSCDALVFAVDANGNTLWTFEWDGGVGYEEIDGLVAKQDGIYITGWTKTAMDEFDITLMKLSFSGSLIWQNQWGSGLPRDDRQDGHIVVDDSMIYLCGVYNSSPAFAFEGRSLLAKFDKLNGNLVDTTLFGRQDPWINAEDALGMSSDGTYLYLTGYTTSAANDWDLFVAKYDKELNQLWYTVWGGVGTADVARSVQPYSNGTVMVAGTTLSYGNGNEEAVLIQFDSSGIPLWYKTWGAADDDHVLDLHIENSSVMYISGKTKSYHSTGKWEAFLMKINIDSLLATSIINFSEKIMVFPNPTEGTFHCRVNQGEEVQLYSSIGEKIQFEEKIIGETLTLNLESYPSGIYFIKATSESGLRLSRIIKK